MLKEFVAVTSFPIKEQVCLGKYKIVYTNSQLVLCRPVTGEGASGVKQDGKGKEVQAVSRHAFLICSKSQTEAKHWQLHSGNLSIKKEDCLLECKWNIVSGRALQEGRGALGMAGPFTECLAQVLARPAQSSFQCLGLCY